jgi:hypothetical protein
MDYRARFYSPALGRFTQPDTFIPNPANSQSWNRYSYVNNNSVNYIDPSGHVLIRLDNGDYFARSTASIIERNIASFEEEFNISFDEGWKLSDKVTMRNEIKTLARKMAGAIGLDGDGSAIFRKIFKNKNITIASKHRGGYGGCEAFVLQIECGSGKIGNMADFLNTGLIIHELGHLFDHRIARNSRGGLVNGYARSQLATVGNGVVASDRTHVVGSFPGEGFVDISDGYKINDDRDDNRPYQQHINGGHGEQWADMVMNWALGSFADNIYGAARDSYMDGVMGEYILSAIGGPARSIYD